MPPASSKFGFVECADMVSAQKYGAALKLYQQAVSNFRDAKTTPKRSEIARQLFQIGAVLEETLKSAFGEQWETQVPHFAEEQKLSCSFCGKSDDEVRKLIAGHSMHICDECVGACNDILTKENIDQVGDAAKPSAATTEQLCGICMEPRDSDELIFLPHAAYMCAACLEEIQIVRDKRGEQ